MTPQENRSLEAGDRAVTHALSAVRARVGRILAQSRARPALTIAVVLAFGTILLLLLSAGHKAAPHSQVAPASATATADRDLADLENFARQSPDGDVSAVPVVAGPEVRKATAADSTAASPPAATPTGPLATVVGLEAGDSLNLRSGPGVQNTILLRLPSGYSGIEITGETVANGPTIWVPVKVGNLQGWVVRKNLYP